MVVGAQCRYVYPEMEYSPEYMEYVPGQFARVRRQAHGSHTVNLDGTSGTALKVPLAGNDRNILSAIGSADLSEHQHLTSSSIGLALDNVNGHSARVMKTHIPGFGDQLTAAGKVNLYQNDNHNLNANAFTTRNMPKIPQVPNFNTVGGGLDYIIFLADLSMFLSGRDRIGASASAAHTDFFNRNDYSLGGRLNLFKDRSNSLDFNAGIKKFETPFMKSGWEPNFGLSFSRFF